MYLEPDLILHGGMAMAFAFAAVYFFLMSRYEYKPKRLFHVTGVLMAVISIQALHYIMLILLDVNRKLLSDVGLSVVVNLLVIPFCSLVLLELTLYRKVTLQVLTVHLLPPILFAIVYTVLLFSPLDYCPLLGIDGRTCVLVMYLAWMLFGIIKY